MSIIILGIDPGASGGYAEIHPNGGVVTHGPMDDSDLPEYVENLVIQSRLAGVALTAYLELVGGFIGKPQPGSSMFKFGNGYGFIRGVLAANYVRTELVRPQDWQKGIPGVQGTKGPDRKRALKEHAARLYPALKVTLKTADALLIAEYGKRQTQ